MIPDAKTPVTSCYRVIFNDRNQVPLRVDASKIAEKGASYHFIAHQDETPNQRPSVVVPRNQVRMIVLEEVARRPGFFILEAMSPLIKPEGTTP